MVQVPPEVVQYLEFPLPDMGFAVNSVPLGMAPTVVELFLIAPP